MSIFDNKILFSFISDVYFPDWIVSISDIPENSSSLIVPNVVSVETQASYKSCSSIYMYNLSVHTRVFAGTVLASWSSL